MGWLTVVLGINKQLDLQSALTAVGRCSAQLGGWYENRRVVQLSFIGIVLLTAVAGSIAVAYIWRQHLRSLWLPILGCLVTVSFVLVRAVGFHHFDRVIGLTVGSAKLNWVLEIAGIMLAILGGLLSRGRPTTPPPVSPSH